MGSIRATYDPPWCANWAESPENVPRDPIATPSAGTGKCRRARRSVNPRVPGSSPGREGQSEDYR